MNTNVFQCFIQFRIISNLVIDSRFQTHRDMKHTDKASLLFVLIRENSWLKRFFRFD